MIKASDVSFHTPADVAYDWAETNYFSFYIPEPNITCWLYIIARPGVGACVVDVQAIDKIGRLGLEALYVDFQQHLPLPAKLEDFTLPNGLSLKTSNEPRDYRIDYIGTGGAELHLDVRGLHEPYDIHDPEMDPLAPKDRNASGFGTAYAGGCTSGHAISGLADLQLPSLVAVLGFFAGGLISTWLILPHLLGR